MEARFSREAAEPSLTSGTEKWMPRFLGVRLYSPVGAQYGTKVSAIRAVGEV
jgi:hypothetical protein